MSDVVINYVASPTLARFHNSRARFRCIRGPVGSGKSVACCMEIVLATARMMPPMEDGVIRAKWLVMRNTYNELKTTTVATMRDWFDKIGMKMHMSPPLEGKIETVSPDGHPMEIFLLFRGMDGENTEASLKSLEISGIWANEACEIPYTRISTAQTRLGRYPKKGDKVAYPALGVIMDTNSPSNANWWYKQETECPENWEFFVQPPALLKVIDPITKAVEYQNNVGQNPLIPPAENIEHHNEGFNYYRYQLSASTDEQITTLILNEFGSRKAGKPVFPEYIDSVHCAKEQMPVLQNLPVILGQDFGRTPATVIGQVGIDGQIRVLEEITSDNMGIDQFVREKLIPVLVNRYGFNQGRRVICFADPAGADPNQIDNVTCIMRMNEMGINTVPAPVMKDRYSNSMFLRIETLSKVLNQRIMDKPSFVINPDCAMLREGFNGGYCYRKMRLNGEEERYTDEPDKNMFSHIHDACQYFVCGVLNSGENFSNAYVGSMRDNEMASILSGCGTSLGPFA